MQRMVEAQRVSEGFMTMIIDADNDWTDAINDWRDALFEEGIETHEAIENLTTLLKEIEKHIQFADKAVPEDIFKPNLTKIENHVDAQDYFNASTTKYHELSDCLLNKLWDWFQNYFGLDKDDQFNEKRRDRHREFMEYYGCERMDFHFVLAYTYAEKLFALPYEQVSRSFNLVDDEGDSIDNPMIEFFGIFADLFDAQGMADLHIDIALIN
jgi:hypothetical protein